MTSEHVYELLISRPDILILTAAFVSLWVLFEFIWRWIKHNIKELTNNIKDALPNAVILAQTI